MADRPTTIDTELDEILIAFARSMVDTSEVKAQEGSYYIEGTFKLEYAKGVLKDLIARSAQKARLDELTLAMNNLHFGGGFLLNRDNRKYLHDRITQLTEEQ